MTNAKVPAQIDRDTAALVEALEARLADGYARIDAAQSAGLDVVAWEGFWLDLLRQYEAACDALGQSEAA